MTPITEQRLHNIHNYGIDEESREIFLHSYISDGEDEPGVDYRSAINFEKNLRYLNSISDDPIFIHMHLPGGCWNDCLGIYDSIKLSKAKTAMLVYAQAESCSSLILQAPTLRILMPNITMLIHYGSISVDNEHKAAMSSIEWSERESQKMIDIFTDQCLRGPMAQKKNWKRVMTKKHILGQLANKSDWILTAQEAVEYGFADGILGVSPYNTIEHIKRKIKK